VVSIADDGARETHAGNSPLQRAIYSFLMFPSLNSADSSLAVLFDKPRIINPEVNLSKRFTASGNNGLRVLCKWRDQTQEPTVYLFVTKLVLEDLHERVPEISSCSMHRLQDNVKRELQY